MGLLKVLVASQDGELPILLRLVLQQETDLVLVGQAKTGGELLARISDSPPDVVLVDLDAPGLGTLAAIGGMIALQGQRARVVGLTSSIEVTNGLPVVADELLLKQEPLGRLPGALRGSQPAVEAVPIREELPLPAAGETAGPAVDVGPQAPSPESLPAAESSGLALESTIAPGPSFQVPVEEPIAPGSVSLVVSPFSSFRWLAAFQQALEGLAGVRDARARGFHRETLYATVQYDGIIPLSECLRRLSQFRPVVLVDTPGIIELRIDPGEEEPLHASTA